MYHDEDVRCMKIMIKHNVSMKMLVRDTFLTKNRDTGSIVLFLNNAWKKETRFPNILYTAIIKVFPNDDDYSTSCRNFSKTNTVTFFFYLLEI